MTTARSGRVWQRIFWPGVVIMSLLLALIVGLRLALPTLRLSATSGSATPSHRPSACAGDSCALGPGVRGVRLFVEPDDGAQPVTSAIAAASHSVWVEIYLLTDARVIGALEEAAQHGVDVRVMLEEHPYGGDVVSPQRTLQTLATAGIQARFANPAYHFTHAKMLIVDSATLFILTANLSRSGLGGSSYTRNREFGVIDAHADDVAEATAIFQADWNHTKPVLHDTNMVVSPVNARAKITALLESARTMLLIEDEEMYDAVSVSTLIEAVRRGVQVRLILPDPSLVAAADVARLKAGGVHLAYVSAPYAHAKIIVADGRLAFVGSENFSPASLDENREVGVLLADPAALATITATFDRDWVVGLPA